MKRLLVGLLMGLYAAVAMAEKPLNVVVSFSILGDLTRNVGKERVNVVEIVGADKDTHTFQPSPADVRKLVDAKLVLMNGLGLEGWMNRMVSASGYRGNIVRVAESLPDLLPAEGHAQAHGSYDPHVWQDPVLTKRYVQEIATALSIVDPAGRVIYEENARRYQDELGKLHAWVERTLDTIPLAKRRVITSHDAFSYLGRRYNVVFMSPQGVSTEAEASAKAVADLVQQIRQTGVRALFVENINSPRLIQTLANEAKVRTGGALYSDALAKHGLASTYLGMYRHNVETLMKGLRQNEVGQ